MKTRASLLHRVRDPADAEAWAEFHDLYAPLLYRFARARGLSACDAEEVRDQCLEVLARRMREFDYESRRGRFKTWLFAIAHGKVVDLHRLRRASRLTTSTLATLRDPAPSLEEQWEADWRAAHLRFALDRTRQRVSARVWSIFERLLDARPVPAICAELDVNPNQVYKARWRVLRTVRALLGVLGERGPESPGQIPPGPADNGRRQPS